MESTEARWQRHVDDGRRYVSQGNYAEAEQSLLAAVKEALTLGPADLRVAASLGILGKLRHRQGDRERAQAFLERALAVREEALGPEHYGVVQGLNDLAALHYAYGNVTEARTLYERALAIAEKQLAPDHGDLALALYNLSRVYFKSGDHLRAEPLLTRLLEIKERTLGPEHTDIAAILTALSRVRSMAGRHDDAEEMARRALAIRERALEPDDPAVAVSLELVAYFCAGRAKRMRSLADAERILGRASGASSGEGLDGASNDSSLETELAALAAEEAELRQRAREIRSRSSGNREPSTLERSPVEEATQPSRVEEAPTAPVAAAPAAPAAPVAPIAPVATSAAPAPESDAAHPEEGVQTGEPEAAPPHVYATDDVAWSVRRDAAEQDTPVTDVEYIPAVIVPPGEIADAPSAEEGRRSLADSLPPILYGRRARWFLGLAAVALIGAGGAGFALGRARGGDTESPAQVQQASRGSIEEPQADSLGAGTLENAPPPPQISWNPSRGATSVARRSAPRIPDWDRSTSRSRSARIPSRSQAQRLTRTMERLGSKVMTGVDTKVDSLGRTVELAPPTFDKP